MLIRKDQLRKILYSAASLDLDFPSGILTAADISSKRVAILTSDYRLFTGSHAADIVVATGKQPTGPMSRKQMIADLKDVSTALGDKKKLVDRVIQALEDEEAEVAGEAGEGPSHSNPVVETDKEEDGTDVQDEDSDESPLI
jgi:hypothetical protein